jgi:hypothetical protein
MSPRDHGLWNPTFCKERKRWATRVKDPNGLIYNLTE